MATNKPKRVAFDIDGTLWRIVKDDYPPKTGIGAICACGMPLKQELNHELASVLRFFVKNGDEVFVWSAGGISYAQSFVDKHFPVERSHVNVIRKAEGQGLDLCFDDQDVSLATVNIKVDSAHADHWQ